jgi:hypothetical protein
MDVVLCRFGWILDGKYAWHQGCHVALFHDMENFAENTSIDKVIVIVQKFASKT